MTKQNALKVIEAIKILLAYSLKTIFRKTEEEETNGETSYVMKHNDYVATIKEAFEFEEDDDVEKFLLYLKQAVSDIKPSQETVIALINMFLLEDGKTIDDVTEEQFKKVLQMIANFQFLHNTNYINIDSNELVYFFSFFDIDVTDEDSDGDNNGDGDMEGDDGGDDGDGGN